MSKDAKPTRKRTLIVWAIGFQVFKINPAVLIGDVARPLSGPCREAAVEILTQ